MSKGKITVSFEKHNFIEKALKQARLEARETRLQFGSFVLTAKLNL